MVTTAHETPEGRLTAFVDKYCDSHNYPCIPGVNGTRIKGWSHIPDRIIGKDTDDVYTKCILIEIKETKENVIKDLNKKEYKDVKYLGIVYYDNQGNMCGSLYSWRKPTGKLELEEIRTTTPLKEFLDYIYEKVYLVANNPDVIQTLDSIYAAEKQGHSFKDEISPNVLLKVFTNVPFLKSLDFSLEKVRKSSNKLKRPCDKIDVFHSKMFSENTRDERYKLGQFITEYPHSLHVAEEVIKIFDQHQDLTIYEPCVGSGAIAEQLLILLFRKYGKRKALKIMQEQLRFADIDSEMQNYAEVVLYLRTEELFGQGQGIRFKIEKNDLETDSFDLSQMIVYGNYPFNKGTDYNYLARIFRKQMDSGLSSGVFIGNVGTFDPRKIQSRNILGNDFYNYIEEKYTTNDFKEVSCSISIVVFDKSRKKIQDNSIKQFDTIIELGIEVGQLSNFPKGACFKNGDSLHSIKYNETNSVTFFRVQELLKHIPFKRVPSPNASTGTLENEIYSRWIQEKPKYIIPKPFTGLVCSRYTTSNGVVRQKYFRELVAFAGTGMTTTFKGSEKYIGIIGLIIASKYFRNTLITLFPKWQKEQRALSITILKTLPIPKNIPERLYEIGQILIIEGKEDEALRKEADEIIQKLYKDLKV